MKSGAARGATAPHTSLNVAGVNLKCQIHSSSVSFSFATLDVVDDLTSTLPSSFIQYLFIDINGKQSNYMEISETST